MPSAITPGSPGCGSRSGSSGIDRSPDSRSGCRSRSAPAADDTRRLSRPPRLQSEIHLVGPVPASLGPKPAEMANFERAGLAGCRPQRRGARHLADRPTPGGESLSRRREESGHAESDDPWRVDRREVVAVRAGRRHRDRGRRAGARLSRHHAPGAGDHPRGLPPDLGHLHAGRRVRAGDLRVPERREGPGRVHRHHGRARMPRQARCQPARAADRVLVLVHPGRDRRPRAGDGEHGQPRAGSRCSGRSPSSPA